MEENKNYTEPEQIEQAEVEAVEKSTLAKPQNVETPAKKDEKKPMNKKLLIIVGAAVLAVAIAVVAVVLLLGGNNEENPPEETTSQVETTSPQESKPTEIPDEYPGDADPKQEDIFYN